MKPLVRREGVVIRDLADETLVYDRERHRAHCLNREAAAVFRLCDGERSAAEIASLLGEPADLRAREALVTAALRQLAEAQLLANGSGSPQVPPADAPMDIADLPRRELLRRVGTALLVPAIATIVAPTPAQAASVCLDASECGVIGNDLKQCSDVGTCDANTCCVAGNCTTCFGCCP